MDIRKKTFTAAKQFSCGRMFHPGDQIEDMYLVARLLDRHPDLITDNKPPPTTKPTEKKEEAD